MTTATTIYNQGDVVLIPFPFTNLSAVKERPAIIISGDGFNRTQEDVILLAITSNPHAEKRTQYIYPLKKADCERAGLFFPSFVKPSKVVTLDQRLIRKRLGRLPIKTLPALILKFNGIFAR